MPTHERVKELIAAVEAGHNLDAYRDFYTEDTVGQDNLGAERVGLAANIARQAAALENVAESRESRAVSFVVDGDHSAIEWIFDFTDRQGKRHRLQEVAWQTWRGDRIVRERFYYDSVGAEGAND